MRRRPRDGGHAGPLTGPTPMESIRDALEAAGLRSEATSATAKKNYAERFSRALATCFANALRPHFAGISPDPSGKKQEMPARTAKGFKKLDVNYSTVDLGLALGVSVKTLNFRDAASARYTKNYTRIDAELRAEATDYHQRQPYSVLVGVLFLPVDACDDAGKAKKAELKNVSSLGEAVRRFRYRAGRETPRDDVDLFERFFIGLYEPDGPEAGATRFLDVMAPPPRARRLRPDEGLSFDEVIAAIVATYNERNDPPFTWAE